MQWDYLIFTLSCDDVVSIEYNGAIDPMFPGWYASENILKIEYLGKASDYFETKKLTVIDHANCVIIFEDAEGNLYRDAYTHWSTEFLAIASCSYEGVNPESIQIGDQVLCAVSGDEVKAEMEILNPAILEKSLLEIVSGDANADGSVNIMDVILINKAIYGKAELSSDQLHAVDCNQNGIPDASDSLVIMKMILNVA